MENNDNILDDINSKLIKISNNFDSIQKQLIDTEINSKKLFEDKESIEKIVENEKQKNCELNEKLIKFRFESNIEREKQLIGLKEQNQQYLAQINRINGQLIEYKHQMNGLQSNQLVSDQKMTQLTADNRQHSQSKAIISSKVIQIKSQIQSIAKYINNIELFQSQLKDLLHKQIEINFELNSISNEINSALNSALNESSTVELKWIDMNSKTNIQINSCDDNKVSVLQLENQMLKEEIDKLRDLVDQYYNEKVSYIETLYKNNSEMENNRSDSEPEIEKL